MFGEEKRYILRSKIGQRSLLLPKNIPRDVWIGGEDSVRTKATDGISHGDVLMEEPSRSLRMRFNRASKKAWTLSSRPSNDLLLEMYALYKQATEGDCLGKAKGGLKERAKWKAWNQVSGTSQSDAMRRYCEVVDSFSLT